MRTENTSKPNLRNNRALRLGTTAAAITVVVIAIVILLNVVCSIFADRFPWVLDLTEDKTYTLSADSVAVAKGVTKNIQIDVLLSEEYFSNPNTGYEETNIILRQFYLFTKEYGSLSGGKVTTKYVDLDKNPTLEDQYEKYKAGAGDIVFLCDGQYRVLNCDSLAEIDTDNYSYYNVQSHVEQQLAANISSVQAGKIVTVTFLTGHGENESNIAALKHLYSINGYMTQTVDFTTAETISDTTEVIVIAAPTYDYSLEEIKRLRDWLSNDGKLGRHLFVYASDASCPQLYKFLEADYGIVVTDDFIVETDSSKIAQGGSGLFPYATIGSSELTLRSLNGQVLAPYTRRLLLKKDDDERNELINLPLISFSDSSRLRPVTKTEDGSNDLQKADTYPIYGVAYAREQTTVDNAVVSTYVVVSGSELIASSANLTKATQDNEELALEPLNTICPLGTEVLLSGKDLNMKTFQTSERTQKILGLGVFTFGIPLVLVAVSLVVFFKRRHL